MPIARPTRLVGVVLLALLVQGLAVASSAQELTPEDVHREIGYAPMPDGVKLAYIAYRPSKEGRFPIIVKYDAYDSDGLALTPDNWIMDFLRRGYAVVGANVRGSGCSEGSHFSILHPQQGKDGAVLIDWLGTRPWSTGKVGMYGVSYPGHTQFFIGAERPKHLVALAAGGLTTSLYREAFRPGGIFNVGFAAWWGELAQPWIAKRGADLRVEGGDTACPVTRAKQPPNRAFYEFQEHPFDDEYWQGRATENAVDMVNVPTLIIQGWQDQQTAMGGARLFPRLNAPKKLILQNGGHGVAGSPLSRAEVMRWMDRWLKDKPNGIDKEPPVSIWFETRVDEGQPKPGWVETFADWPVPSTAWRTFYLAADGALSPTPLEKKQRGTRTYVYPMGTEMVGNNTMFAIPPSPLGSLVYRTDPFAAETAVLGSVQFVFHVSSERRDTDFMVVLHDVGPDGETLYLQRSFLRASHRAVDQKRSSAHWAFHPHDRSDPLVPGQVYEIRISFPELGHVFRPGHALELMVLAPSFAPSPDWGPMPLDLPGVNTIHHSAEHPSRLSIPVVPGIVARATPPECGSLEYQPCRPKVVPNFTAAGMPRDLRPPN